MKRLGSAWAGRPVNAVGDHGLDLAGFGQGRLVRSGGAALFGPEQGCADQHGQSTGVPERSGISRGGNTARGKEREIDDVVHALEELEDAEQRWRLVRRERPPMSTGLETLDR